MGFLKLYISHIKHDLAAFLGNIGKILATFFHHLVTLLEREKWRQSDLNKNQVEPNFSLFATIASDRAPKDEIMFQEIMQNRISPPAAPHEGSTTFDLHQRLTDEAERILDQNR